MLVVWRNDNLFDPTDGMAGCWIQPPYIRAYPCAATTIIAASAGFDAPANPSSFHLFCIDIIMTSLLLERPPTAVVAGTASPSAVAVDYYDDVDDDAFAIIASDRRLIDTPH